MHRHVGSMCAVAVLLVVTGFAAGLPAVKRSAVAIERSDVQRREWNSRIANESDRCREREHIAAHLARVEAVLRAADANRLTPMQRRARARNLDLLRAYHERGVFPHNHQIAGRRTPVFIDAHGTHCAVGHLIAQSGGRNLARRIAAERNTATIAELGDDVELAAWLQAAGLTAVEAAMIQPGYGFSAAEEQDVGYGVATLAATAVGGGVFAWQLAGDASAWRDGLGLGAGLAQLGLATYGFAEYDPIEDLEAAFVATNLALGVGNCVLALVALQRDDGARPPSPTASNDTTTPWRLAGWTAPETAGVRIGRRF